MKNDVKEKARCQYVGRVGPTITKKPSQRTPVRCSARAGLTAPHNHRQESWNSSGSGDPIEASDM